MADISLETSSSSDEEEDLELQDETVGRDFVAVTTGVDVGAGEDGDGEQDGGENKHEDDGKREAEEKMERAAAKDGKPKITQGELSSLAARIADALNSELMEDDDDKDDDDKEEEEDENDEEVEQADDEKIWSVFSGSKVSSHEDPILPGNANPKRAFQKKKNGQYVLRDNDAVETYGNIDANTNAIELPQPRKRAGKRKGKKDTDAPFRGKDGKIDEWTAFTPSTMTPMLRQELRIIAAREHLDPKRFFKRSGKKRRLNTNVQFGQVIDDAKDWYIDRVSKKEAKRSNLQSVLQNRDVRGYLKAKFLEIQESKPSRSKKKGKKGFKKSRGRKKK